MSEQSFPVLQVTREDLADYAKELGFKVTDITDQQMKDLAEEMGSRISMDIYWDAFSEAVDEILGDNS